MTTRSWSPFTRNVVGATIPLLIAAVVVWALGLPSAIARGNEAADEITRMKPQLEKVKTEQAVLLERVTNQGRTLDEVRGDVKLLLQRIPAK